MNVRGRRLPKSVDGGHSVIEVTLMAPWIFLLFMAVLNVGFYAYALISVQNAVRVAAMYTSSTPSAAGDTAGACFQALEELRMLPNVPATLTTCTAAPVQVTAQSITGTACADDIPTALCTRVTLTYQTIPLFPLPGLAGQMSITRRVEAKVKQD